MRYRVFLLIFAGFLIQGCMFLGLREDVKLLDETTTISGTLKTTSPQNKPIFVALYQPEENDQYRLATYSVMYGAGTFEFLRERGDYYVFAFEDANEDFTYQHDEYVGWYGAPTLLQARPGVNFSKLDLVLRSPDQAKQELPALFAPNVPHVSLQDENRRLGDIVTLDDPRFSPDSGAMGMWEPVKFYQQGYNGIFFFEPYRPEKIPVLLIHGINGSGYDWRYIIEHLDRSRFQPWVVQYPSGMRLGLLSEALNQAVTELHVRYKFKSLYVVAHSMGGLVARGLINHNAANNDQDTIKLFVTISTPWQGHAAARLGVSNAPVVVPSWYDMVPGSPYLKGLFEPLLPHHVSYYLLFSHRGTRSLIGRANSDGTVTLRSQLPLVAQDQAKKIFGYDEDHVSILRSEAVVRRLNEIMVAVQDQDQDQDQ